MKVKVAWMPMVKNGQGGRDWIYKKKTNEKRVPCRHEDTGGLYRSP